MSTADAAAYGRDDRNSHVAKLAQTEEVGTVSRVIEGERRVGVDGHGQSVGGRVDLLTSVQLERVEVGSVRSHFRL